MSDEQQRDSVNYPPPAVESPTGPPEPAPAQRVEPPAPLAVARSPKGRGNFGRGFGMGFGLALGAGVVVTVAAVLGGVLMIIASLSLISAGNTMASTNLTTIWGEGSKTLRAVTINGVIMNDSSDGSLLSTGTYGQEIAREIDKLTQDSAAGLVLLVNTPGGSIGGSRAISDAIVRYQERTGQKVFVHISGLSASGGVYATAPADEIIADNGALVGSIGVIMGPYEQYNGVTSITGTLLDSGVTTSGGITRQYLTAGEGKDFGNPWRAMTEKERENYQTGVNNEYASFVNHVSTHRGISEERIKNEMGAYVYDPIRAQSYGLIDAVMGRDEFFRHVAVAAGLDPNETKVEAIAPPSSLLTLLGATRAYGVAPAAEQGEGVVPVLSASICGGHEVLAFSGNLATVCG